MSDVSRKNIRKWVIVEYIPCLERINGEFVQFHIVLRILFVICGYYWTFAGRIAKLLELAKEIVERQTDVDTAVKVRKFGIPLVRFVAEKEKPDRFPIEKGLYLTCHFFTGYAADLTLDEHRGRKPVENRF